MATCTRVINMDRVATRQFRDSAMTQFIKTVRDMHSVQYITIGITGHSIILDQRLRKTHDRQQMQVRRRERDEYA